MEVKSFQHIKKVSSYVKIMLTFTKTTLSNDLLLHLQILAIARKNRITFGTQMNQHSSRSHALLTVTVLGTDLASGAKTTGQSQRLWNNLDLSCVRIFKVTSSPSKSHHYA